MDKDKLAKGAADNHPKRADSCVAESLKASCANSPAGVAPRSNAALEKLARETVERIQELPNGLTVHPGMMTDRFLAALQRAVEAYENKLQDAEELEQLWHERFDESQRAVASEREHRERCQERHRYFDELAKAHDCACLTDAFVQLKNARAQLAEMDKELERERMCHAACGVIAMSNTPESLAKNRKMRPEYLSASVQDCIKAAEREINLTAQLAAAKERFDESQRIVAEKDDMWTRASEQAETMADYLLDAKAEAAALTAQLAERQKTHDELCLRYQNRVAQLAAAKELLRALCGCPTVAGLSAAIRDHARERHVKDELASARAFLKDNGGKEGK